MAGLMRGMGIGVGLLTLGYGVYRASRGHRDWMASTAITAGLSMALAGMVRRRTPRRNMQLARLAKQVTRTVPSFSASMLKRTRLRMPSLRMRAGTDILPIFR